MRLHYFTTEQFGLEAIRDRRLKIARINELNDSFDFMGLALKRRADRKVMRHWKKGMADRFGLLCMSRDWHHPILWGHYADKNRGLCLCFDVAENDKFTKVEYLDERLTLGEFGCNSLAELNETDMKKLLHMKFSDWKYESEYRAFRELKEKDPVSGLHFMPFSDDLKLAHVIVGERSSVTRCELANVLGERASADSVTSFKARPRFKKQFGIVENKSRKDWR